jgi:hypothetical protein
MSTAEYEKYGFGPHYCRAWGWSDETQAVLDRATSVEELRASWRELEADGEVDSYGGSEWHHALAHLDNELTRQAIIKTTGRDQGHE